MRQAADRRRAKTDQSIARIGRVALKITPQPALGLGARHGIVSARKMVKPDPHITGIDQFIGDRLRLIVTRTAFRQIGFVDSCAGVS